MFGLAEVEAVAEATTALESILWLASPRPGASSPERCVVPAGDSRHEEAADDEDRPAEQLESVCARNESSPKKKTSCVHAAALTIR